MAGDFKMSTFRAKQFSYDVFFDGALLSNTRASLVVELIKYFLYERQQIPLPVDELRDQVLQEENLLEDRKQHHGKTISSSSLGPNSLTLNTHSSFGCDTNRIIHPTSQSLDMFKSGTHSYSDIRLTDVTNVDIYHNRSSSHVVAAGSNCKEVSKGPCSKIFQDRKTKVLVSDLTKLFDSLQNAFESCPEIEKVAVILGGTVMNPKESYLISFPPPSPEADCIPLLACKRTLFQQIISEDILGTMRSNISPTNMMVLVSAPRSCPLKGFLPKQCLRAPRTGDIISFNFHCNYLLPVCYDLTIGDEDFEISGIEPFDIHGKKKVALEKSTLAEVSAFDEGGSHMRKEFVEHNRISDYEHHVQLEFSKLKLSGDFHVTTPGINHTDQSLNLKPCLISSTPVLKSDSLIARSETSQNNLDFIWYQSPFVIKGYRIKDHIQNRPNFS